MEFKVNPAVTEIKAVEISPATYTVTLTKEEAVVIASLLGKVGGNGDFAKTAKDLWNNGFERFFEKPGYAYFFYHDNNKISYFTDEKL